MRTIESPVEKVQAYLFTNDRLETSEYATSMVPLDKIFMLEKDIPLEYNPTETGLKTPLLLLSNTQHNYDMCAHRIGKDLVQERDEKIPFICYAGNQRLTALKNLEYDAVQCIFVDDINWAHAVNLVLQEGKATNYN